MNDHTCLEGIMQKSDQVPFTLSEGKNKLSMKTALVS